MTYSWSHKLFLAINQRIGRGSFVDRIMIFSAKWLIWILGGVFVYFVFRFADGSFSLFQRTDIFRIVFPAAVFSFFISYAGALVWSHPRPVRELPDVQTLIHTLGTWKSFPSDHTMGAAFLWIGMWYTQTSSVILSLFAALALLVAISRVYVGVHYPRDILAGAALPFIVLFVLSGVS